MPNTSSVTLVVESRVRRKKSRGIGVFKFAQTVENDAWDDEKQAKDIQVTLFAPRVHFPELIDQISRLTREAEAAPDALPTSIAGTGPISPTVTKRDEARRYTVLARDDYDDQNAEYSKPSRPTIPPKVISAKDAPPKRAQPDIKLYDAVLTTDTAAPSALDSEMEKFIPMLNDYLKLHDVVLNPQSKDGSSGGDITMQNDDYVWDVFYHRPATLSEWVQAANVATISGLPPWVTNEYDSASESEEEDEADEDSNAEEYYKNDYPEDEDSSSWSAVVLTIAADEFHEHSDHDDVVRYDEQGGDDW
ncbi:hypothetical protein H0H92_006059 [Tricholoma furcatifolium]|nr:hypothetical protein H0H92_006059 [Tricholoma furcatifolium]